MIRCGFKNWPFSFFASELFAQTIHFVGSISRSVCKIFMLCHSYHTIEQWMICCVMYGSMLQIIAFLKIGKTGQNSKEMAHEIHPLSLLSMTSSSLRAKKKGKNNRMFVHRKPCTRSWSEVKFNCENRKE